MNNVIIEIAGIADEDVIEEIFESKDSGFDVTHEGFGRTKRYSHLGDVVAIAGQIVSLATFAKTLFQLFVSNETKKSKTNTSEANELSEIRIKNKHGITVTITSADKSSISEILKKHLE